MKSFINIGLGIVGGILGNLIAAWIQNDIWNNAFTPTRLIASGFGLIAIWITLAFIDAQTQTTNTEKGILRNWQIGGSLIRVMKGTNVIGNVQIGKGNTIEVK